jgi:hypothetical protein
MQAMSRRREPLPYVPAFAIAFSFICSPKGGHPIVQCAGTHLGYNLLVVSGGHSYYAVLVITPYCRWWC